MKLHRTVLFAICEFDFVCIVLIWFVWELVILSKRQMLLIFQAWGIAYVGHGTAFCTVKTFSAVMGQCLLGVTVSRDRVDKSDSCLEQIFSDPNQRLLTLSILPSFLLSVGVTVSRNRVANSDSCLKQTFSDPNQTLLTLSILASFPLSVGVTVSRDRVANSDSCLEQTFGDPNQRLLTLSILPSFLLSMAQTTGLRQNVCRFKSPTSGWLTFSCSNLLDVMNAIIDIPRRWSAAARVVANSTLVCMTVGTCMGKRLHVQPSHPALGEHQAFSWKTLTNTHEWQTCGRQR